MSAGLDGAALALWRDVAVPVRDGTITRADVWRPVADGPVPAVLMRTPYGKERSVPSAVLDPATAVAAGFAVVVQDVRGIAGGAPRPPRERARSRSTSATSASSCLREAGSRCSCPVASRAASRRRQRQPSSAWTARRSRSRRSDPSRRYPRDVTGDAAPMAANGTALPVLRTPRLVIRPLGDTDEDACRSVLAVPDEDGFRRWLTWAVAAPAALADLHQPPYGERAVVLATTGDLVGLVGLVPALGPFDQLDGARPGGPWTPELGLYWALAPAYRGNGYATEAAAALCRALFAALTPKRLIAMTERTNDASQAVMRRLGMRLLANPHPEPSWLQIVGVLDAAPGQSV